VYRVEKVNTRLQLRIAKREGDRDRYEELRDRDGDEHQMAAWVQDLVYPDVWRLISHLTFSWECSIWSGQRCYEKFMRTHLPRVSYFYALEHNPGRDGFHVHALWADCQNVYRKEVWATWFQRYGRARIEPVRNFGDVADYCSKYVTKEGAWWDVKLQWHRRQKIQNAAFVLRPTDSLA